MPETSFVFEMIFLYLLVITHSHADNYTITGCSSDGYIDVREDTGTTITCDGIQGQMIGIYWALSGIRIGDCGYPYKFYYCLLTDPNNTDYRLSRQSISRSELRILGNFSSKAGQNLTCSRKNNDTKVSCVINIISAEAPQATNTAAIGGGVGAVIAVIIVAVIVLVIVVRRRHQTNDSSPRGTDHAHVLSTSEPRDSDTVSTLEGCHTKLRHDAKTDKPAVAADPTANVKLGQRQTAVSEEPGMNTYEQPSQRRNEDTYLYTDLTPSVTSSAPDDASRVYRGNSIGARQSLEPEMNTYEQPSSRSNEESYLYTDLTPSVTFSDHSGVTRASNDPARDYSDINIATGQGN